MTRDALQQVIEEAARLLKDIEQQDRGTTHWAGCEQSHPRCRTRAVIGQFLTLVRDLQQEKDNVAQRLEDVNVKDRIKTGEINVLTVENRRLAAEVTRLTALIAQAQRCDRCEPTLARKCHHEGCQRYDRHDQKLAVPREGQQPHTQGDTRGETGQPQACPPAGSTAMGKRAS